MAESRGRRGRQREGDLIKAGVALLTEGGWAAVTHRAVAARAEANPGLVHYYFKGTPGLRRAVARQAARMSIATVIDDVLAADSVDEMVAVLRQALEAVRGDAGGAGRVLAELASASFDDPEVRAVVRAEFADGRARLERRLAASHRWWPEGRAADVAAILVAVVDGLALHVWLDSDLPAQRLVTTLGALVCAAEHSWSNT